MYIVHLNKTIIYEKFATFIFFILLSCSSDSPEEVIPSTVTYTLTVATSDGGSVSSAGGKYDKGAAVVITATAADGYTFSGWEGSDSSDAVLNVTMIANLTLTANFTQNPVDTTQYTLTVSAGTGGSVSTAGGTYEEGAEVTIVATADDVYTFFDWEGSESTQVSLTLTVSSNATITASFVQDVASITQYTLTVSAGTGGSVSSTGGLYDEGTEVTITTTANDGYTFSSWVGNASTQTSVTITINADVTLNANFTQNISSSIDNFEMVYPAVVKGIAQSEFESIFSSASARMSSRPATILTIVYPLGDYIRDGGAWEGGFNTFETVLNATEVATIRTSISTWFTANTNIPASFLDDAVDEYMVYVTGGGDLASHFGVSPTARLVMIGVPNDMAAQSLKKTFIHETYHAFQQDLETDSCRDTEPPAASSNSGWLVEGSAEYFAHTVGESLGIPGASKSNFLETALGDYNGQLADNDDTASELGRNASKSAAAIHLMILKGYLQESDVMDGSLFQDCARQGTYGPSNTDIPFIKSNWYNIISTNGVYSYPTDI